MCWLYNQLLKVGVGTERHRYQLLNVAGRVFVLHDTASAQYILRWVPLVWIALLMLLDNSQNLSFCGQFEVLVYFFEVVDKRHHEQFVFVLKNIFIKLFSLFTMISQHVDQLFSSFIYWLSFFGWNCCLLWSRWVITFLYTVCFLRILGCDASLGGLALCKKDSKL